MDNGKRELAKKDESAAEKWKMIMLEVKFESNVNGAKEDKADCEKADTPLFERLYIYSQRNLVKANSST